MTRSPRMPDATSIDGPTSPNGPSAPDRRALIGKLALGGAGAAVGVGLLSTGSAKAVGGRLVQQVEPPAVGASYFPITPQRAYDSRQPNYEEGGLLAPDSDRLISVADGHSADGTVTEEDVVPEGATAVHLNLTAAEMTGRNFLSITPGDVTTTETSAVNWADDGDQVANAITVSLDEDRQVRVYCGNQTGSTHVIVDVFGYYVQPEPPTPPE